MIKRHGMSKTREYAIWCKMIRRCYCVSEPRYEIYGARGISICERWKNSFENFFEDMGFSNGLSIDRIDNNGNYCPENCRWATNKEQANNRSTNVSITHEGTTMNMAGWCEKLGIPKSTLFFRIHNGWSIERALTKKHQI